MNNTVNLLYFFTNWYRRDPLKTNVYCAYWTISGNMLHRRIRDSTPKGVVRRRSGNNDVTAG